MAYGDDNMFLLSFVGCFFFRLATKQPAEVQEGMQESVQPTLHCVRTWGMEHRNTFGLY